jgi:tetratricopeptide (TPR) repeat protein
VIARAALALAAVVIAAALAVQLSAERRHSRAADALAPGPGLTPEVRREALRDLEDVTSLLPGTRALLTAAGSRLAFDELSEAERLVRRAIDREPRNFAAHAALALVLDRGGDRAGAERALDRVEQLNPLYPRPPLE